MKVMIDTNIIISAVLFPGGKASSAMFKALLPPFKPLISDLILSELHQKFQEKFPADQPKLDAFFEYALPVIQIVDTPRVPVKSELNIRNIKDRPILRAALASDADYYLTGDKDFLESGVAEPRIISASDFLLI